VIGPRGTGAEGFEEEEEVMLEGPPLDVEEEEKGLLGPEKAFLK